MNTSFLEIVGLVFLSAGRFIGLFTYWEVKGLETHSSSLSVSNRWRNKCLQMFRRFYDECPNVQAVGVTETAWSQRRQHCDLSKHLRLFTKRHGFISPEGLSQQHRRQNLRSLRMNSTVGMWATCIVRALRKPMSSNLETLRQLQLYGCYWYYYYFYYHLLLLLLLMGRAVAQLVEALRLKKGGPCFDSLCGPWKFTNDLILLSASSSPGVHSDF
jgi:hypothetical protein